MQVNKQHLELYTEQWTGSKSGKEYVRAVYCHSPFFKLYAEYIMQMLGCMKHKLESRLGEISVTSDMQMTPPIWLKVKKNQTAS